MAWTTPKDWTTGQVVTEADLDTHLRDNTRYLKGLDGPVTISNALIVQNGLTVQNTALGTTAGNTVDLITTDAGTANSMRLVSRLYRYAAGSSWDTAHIQLTRYVDATQQGIFTFGLSKFGFNVLNPQGAIHTYGSIGGELFQDYDAVGGTSVAVLPASSVVYGAQWMAVVRASGGGMSFAGITVNTQAYGTPTGGNFAIYYTGSGADYLGLRINTNGSVELQRIAGSMTYKVALHFVYL